MSARPMTPEQVAQKRAYHAQKSREWYARNAEARRAKAAQRRKDHPDKVKSSKQQWAERYPDRAKRSARNTRLRAYGITLADYERLFAQQGEKCAICGSDTPKSRNGWSLDHCHETSVVRGILCHPCNILLGLAEDDPSVLASAIQYLQRNGGHDHA